MEESSLSIGMVKEAGAVNRLPATGDEEEGVCIIKHLWSERR